MPKLPSGRIVGITHERARYHAARRRLPIAANTPHHKLYPYIDVVVANPADPPEHWQHRYRFTGHTLADTKWLAQWPEADRAVFLEWLQRREQHREIEDARKRLGADELPSHVTSYAYPKQLYSVLRRRLETLPQASAPASQWLNTVRNMRRNGIREDEIHCSGLVGFLETLRDRDDRSVSREELLARIDFSDIRLELVTELSQQAEALQFEEVARLLPSWRLAVHGLPVEEGDVGVLRLVNHEHNYRVGVLRRRGSTQPKGWFVLSPHDGLIAGLHAQRDLAVSVANAHALRSARMHTALRRRNRYEYLSLDGGSDYREWLLTLPDYPRTFFSGHYAERNLLLHVRTKLRTDLKGRRLLFIEEIQSDWHQAAARHGYENCWGGHIALAPFRRDWIALALKMMLLHVVEEGLDGIAWADGKVQALRYGKTMAPVTRFYDHELPAALLRLATVWNGRLEQTQIRTKHPWLRMSRQDGLWRVHDSQGRFSTRARYDQHAALRLIARHSGFVDLGVPVFMLPDAMRTHIREYGLPLFGEFLS